MDDYKHKEYNPNIKYSRGGDKSSYLDSFSGLEVKVVNNNFDRAFKIFRALVQKDRVLSSYKQKQTYEKPSEKKRRKRDENRRRIFETEAKAKKNLAEANNASSKFKSRESDE